jgi:uncharacterized protein involved in exopolysaccharide biosynthesis
MFLRLVNYVVQRKKFVGIVTLVFFAASIVFVVAIGKRYEVRTLLLPPIETQGEGVLASWMTSLNLPSAVAPSTAGSTSATVLVDLLQSRRLGMMIIDGLDLNAHFKTSNADDALKELGARTNMTVTETGLIRINIRDRSPDYALRIAKAYITDLDSLNQYLQNSRAERTRAFVSLQLDHYRGELAAVRDRIARFQEAHGIVDFDEQVRGAIDVASDLKVRAVLAEIDRDMYREFSRKDAIGLQRKEAEFDNLNKQLSMIVSGDSSSTVFIPLDKLPALTQEYAAMQRDLEVSERVYGYLLEKYEEAGIEKAQTSPVVQVVDEPLLPEKPAGTPWVKIIVVLTLIGFVWSSGVLALLGWVKMRECSGEEKVAYDDLNASLQRDLAWLRRVFRF